MSASVSDNMDAKLTVPNVVTTVRIGMAVVAAWGFIAARFEILAVVLCAAAALLDWFDGWYARTFRQCSNLGKHLDPLADKLLMAVVFGAIGFHLQSGWVWSLIVAVAIRELGMTLFRAYSLRRHRKFIPANRLGKAKMIMQSVAGVGLLAAIYGFGPARVPLWLAGTALTSILAISYLSAGVYLRAWISADGHPQEVANLRLEENDGRLVVGE